MFTISKDGKYNNFEEIDTLDLILKEININLINNSFYSALTLAITLPDICGKIAFPNLKKNRDRYSTWFDKNVRSHIFGTLYSENYFDIKDRINMNGINCYYLRCVLLHEGTDDINEKTKINEFVLSFTKEEFLRGNVAGTEYDDYFKANNYLYVGIKELCEDLIYSVKLFFQNNPNFNKLKPKLKINYNGGKINQYLFVRGIKK